MQNVHAMRPEVREEYAAGAARLDGDAAFHAARWSASSPSCATRSSRSTATTRASPRSGRAAGGDGRAAARARPELRRLDHEREITPDWLQREQAVGYVTYADRFAGTLGACASGCPTCASSA